MTFARAKRVSLLLFSAIMIASVTAAFATQSDLASTANIFLYPKPYRIADLVLRNASGRPVSLNDYRGKVVLLHFWSIQCPACRMEEPLLDSLKRAFGPSGLEILGVNLIDPPNAVAAHAAQNRLPFPVLVDGGTGFDLRPMEMAGKRTAFLVNPAKEAVLEIPALPTTYIINCKGDVVGYSIGAARWNHQAAVKLIQGLVVQSKSCGLDGSTLHSGL